MLPTPAAMRPSGSATAIAAFADTFKSDGVMRAMMRSPHDGTQTLVKATTSDAHGVAPTAIGALMRLSFASTRTTVPAVRSGIQMASSEAAAPGASAMARVASVFRLEMGIWPAGEV